MLSALGYLTIAVILALLLTNRVAAVVALAGVPIVAAFIAGFSPEEVGGFVSGGLGGVVGVATMFIFAITYFGVMRDAGLFDPILRRIIRWAGRAPVTVTVGTTALAAVAHLDGAGATTFLITIPAMMPLYDRLGMSRITLTVCTGLGAGVMNVLPWGGPTARAATTVGVDSNELWVPVIPAQVVGIVAALGIAYFLGRREQRRLTQAGTLVGADARGARGAESADGAGRAPADETGDGEGGYQLSDDEVALRRPKLYWFNVVLTVATLGTLVAGVAPPEMIFVIAVIIALIVNYPGLKMQTARIEAHATGAMLMATTLLAAGIFLGVISQSGMIEEMAVTAAELIPDVAAPALPVIVGVMGVPLSLIFGPDAYYFGVLPVLTAFGEQHGIAPEILAQASILGQETVGFPISPMTGAFYLLVGLAGVDIGKHIRALFGWAWLVSIIMLATAVAMGVIPLWV